MAENDDALDRKGAWIERMFDRLFNGVKENPVATILVFSLLLNVYQFHLNDVKTDKIIELTNASKQEMIREIRNTVDRELPKQIAPLKNQQDSTNKRLDTSLQQLDETVQKVNKKYNR